MSLKEKTPAQLLDELITTDLRCWFAQEQIMNPELSIEQRFDAAVRAQEQNAKRTELIRILDEFFGFTKETNTTKSYHSYFDGKKNNEK